MVELLNMNHYTQKQQEIQPVITTSGNESAEIMIDSGNANTQSQSIQGKYVLLLG